MKKLPMQVHLVISIPIIVSILTQESHSLECAFSIGHGDDLSSSDSLTNNPPETVMTVCQKHEDACFTTFHAYFDVKENRPLSKIKSQGCLDSQLATATSTFGNNPSTTVLDKNDCPRIKECTTLPSPEDLLLSLDMSQNHTVFCCCQGPRCNTKSLSDSFSMGHGMSHLTGANSDPHFHSEYFPKSSQDVGKHQMLMNQYPVINYSVEYVFRGVLIVAIVVVVLSFALACDHYRGRGRPVQHLWGRGTARRKLIDPSIFKPQFSSKAEQDKEDVEWYNERFRSKRQEVICDEQEEPKESGFVREVTREVGVEVDSNSLVIDNEAVLSRGKFSKVCKGSIQILKERKTIIVKTLCDELEQCTANDHRRIVGSQRIKNELNVYNLLSDESDLFSKCHGIILKEEENFIPRLILNYEPLGDLRTILSINTPDFATFCRMSLSVTRGVNFLHSKSDTCTGVGKIKPSIAHRDLSSANVLVREDGTCLLCDFDQSVILTGLSQRLESGSLLPDLDVKSLVYQSPEILEGNIKIRDMEAGLRKADVYSLSLVIWEIASRCCDLYQGAPVPPPQLPYQKEVGTNPSLHQMIITVCRHKSRPLLPNIWKEINPAVCSLRETLTECWDDDPEARLTPACVEKRLMDLPVLRDKYLTLQHRLACPSGPTLDVGLTALPNNQCKSFTDRLHLNPSDLSSSFDYRINNLKRNEESMYRQTKRVNEVVDNQRIGSSVTLSFPIQPFQGVNPCLERNLMSQTSSSREENDTTLLHHTLKFTGNHQTSLSSPSHNSGRNDGRFERRSNIDHDIPAQRLRRHRNPKPPPVKECIKNDFDRLPKKLNSFTQQEQNEVVVERQEVDRMPLITRPSLKDSIKLFSTMLLSRRPTTDFDIEASAQSQVLLLESPSTDVSCKDERKIDSTTDPKVL